MIRRITIPVLLALVASACASTRTPPALEDASRIYTRVSAQPGAAQAVGGELSRAEQAINAAEVAVQRDENQDYVNGLARIALRTAQAAEAEYERARLDRATDSLRQVRMQRLLSLSEAQRQNLLQQQMLSEQEIAALRARNMLVAAEADSLRRVAIATQERLEAALNQVRTLVVEITNIRETARGLVIDLSDVLFDVDKATLKPGAEQNLARVATILQQFPDYNIAVEGHTDATGPDAYNMDLSTRRAAAVREALVRGGVDQARITSRGFGETQPRATNETAAGRQLNRRVEVVVLGAGTVNDALGAAADTTATPPDTTRRPPR